MKLVYLYKSCIIKLIQLKIIYDTTGGIYMLNLQWKEKIKKVTDIEESRKYVPEKAKLVGMVFFYLFFGLLILLLLFMIIGLFQQSHFILATILTIIGIGCLFFLLKIIRADSLNSKN